MLPVLPQRVVLCVTAHTTAAANTTPPATTAIVISGAGFELGGPQLPPLDVHWTHVPFVPTVKPCTHRSHDELPHASQLLGQAKHDGDSAPRYSFGWHATQPPEPSMPRAPACPLPNDSSAAHGTHRVPSLHSSAAQAVQRRPEGWYPALPSPVWQMAHAPAARHWRQCATVAEHSTHSIRP